MKLIDAEYGNWYAEEVPQEVFLGVIEDLVEHIPTIILEQLWVSCNERQPDKSNWYLVELDDGRYAIRWYSSSHGLECTKKDNDVIAWLQNPET